MKNLKQQELSTLSPQKRNFSTIIIIVVTILLFSGLGVYLQFGEMPVAESEFFKNLIISVDTPWDEIVYKYPPKNYESTVKSVNIESPPCIYHEEYSGICKLDFMSNPFNPQPILFKKEPRRHPLLMYHDSLTTVVHSDNSEFRARSKKTIKKRVLIELGGLRYLYGRYLVKSSNLKGKIKVKVQITASGTVIRAIILKSNLDSPNLERDLVKRIKRWKFDRVPKGITTAILIFELSIKGDA